MDKEKVLTNDKAEIPRNVLNTNLPLIIYGTGTYATQVFNYLEKHKIKINAACVDGIHINNEKKYWNKIPVYHVDQLYTQFDSFNVIIGFSEFHYAENKIINGCEEIFFLNNNSLFVNLSNLPKVVAQMHLFFKSNSAVFNIKNIIHLYYACLSSSVEFKHYNELHDEIHLQTKDGLNIITDRYFWIFNEIFGEKQYAVYKDYIDSEYVIFDIGANRGYSALFFAQDKICKQVFSFEPDKTTFAFLQKNLSLNPKQAEKVKAYNYGLYNKNEILTFFQPQDGSDAVNTSKMEFGEYHWSNERKSKIKESLLEVKQASEVMTDLLSEFDTLTQLPKIMKIDIEGAEYEVLSELKESGLLRTFSIIFGECHFGMEGIMDICDKDFNLVYLKKETMDEVYNFLLVNKLQTI